MQEITINYMQTGDLNQICEIERSVFPDPWSYHMFEEELRLPDLYNLLIVRVDAEIAAYGGILIIHNECHITNLAVKPDWQSKGIGTILLSQLVKLAILRKAKNLSLEVRIDNDIAQKLYSKFLFTIIGIRRHYYGYEEDALIMSAEGIDDPSYFQKVNELSQPKNNYKIKSFI